MLKKNIPFESEPINIEQKTQSEPISEKKHSKAYYKLLHTYNTLTAPSKIEPISINCCSTPILAQRLFCCKLNQKQQLNPQIQAFLNNQEQKRNLNLQQIKKDQILRKDSQNQLLIEDEQDEGFQIGEKDQLDQVVQMGAKYIGGLMKGFLPGLSLNNFNLKK